MQSNREFEDLEEFIAAVTEAGVRKLAFAQTNEKRAVEVEHGVLQVVRVTRVEIIAYNKPVILKVVLQDRDLDAIHDDLVRRGFEVNRTSRNIT